jgi:hypothetical protein
MGSDRDNIRDIYSKINDVHLEQAYTGIPADNSPSDQVYRELQEQAGKIVNPNITKLKSSEMIAPLMASYMASRIPDMFDEFHMENVNTDPNWSTYSKEELLERFQKSSWFQWNNLIEDAVEQFKDSIPYVGDEMEKRITNNKRLDGFKSYDIISLLQGIIDSARGVDDVSDWDM